MPVGRNIAMGGRNPAYFDRPVLEGGVACVKAGIDDTDPHRLRAFLQLGLPIDD